MVLQVETLEAVASVIKKILVAVTCSLVFAGCVDAREVRQVDELPADHKVELQEPDTSWDDGAIQSMMTVVIM